MISRTVKMELNEMQNYLEALRKKLRKYNISEVARDSGISRTALNGILHGKTDPRVSIIQRLADYIDRN